MELTSSVATLDMSTLAGLKSSVCANTRKGKVITTFPDDAAAESPQVAIFAATQNHHRTRQPLTFQRVERGARLVALRERGAQFQLPHLGAEVQALIHIAAAAAALLRMRCAIRSQRTETDSGGCGALRLRPPIDRSKRTQTTKTMGRLLQDWDRKSFFFFVSLPTTTTIRTRMLC